MNLPHPVHVVGAGLAGLVAARTVVDSGLPCVIHEVTPTPGGRARTDDHHGFSFNRGPHAFYVGGPGAEVLSTLGVRPRGRAPVTKGTMMVRDGEASLAPVSFPSLLRTPLLGVRGRADLGRLLSRLPRLDPSTLAGTTTSEWIARCTDDARAAQILHTLVRLTTYVNAPDDLSAEVAVRQLQLGVGPGVVYLDGGWRQLVEALHDPRVERAPMGFVHEVPDAAAVILATGSPTSTSSILGTDIDHGPSADAATLDLGLARPPRHRVVLGLDRPMYLSDHGFPDAMTPADRTSVSLVQYLAPGDEPDRDELGGFARHAGIHRSDVVAERYLHRMTVVSSIATAASGGLRERPPVVHAGAPGIFLAGDWVGDRGHLADAAICSGREAGLAAVGHVRSRTVVG